MTTLATRIPVFGIGETEAVLDYVYEAIPELCERLGLDEATASEVFKLGTESCRACGERMGAVLTKGSVEPIPEARAFWNLLCDLFVSSESELYGAGNLEAAVHHMLGGGNVLMVQNHRSGADTMVWEALANRHFGFDIASDWAYMSGHAVNLYLIPFMFTAAIRRFQIFSVKYQSSGLPGIADENAMRSQNLRALRALSGHARPGGKLVGLYAEGGRGDGSMKRGEARTMCVPAMMAKSGPDLMVLPTYVDGSNNVLPTTRGANEYNEVFINARKGTASLSVGKPVMWREIAGHPLAASGDDDAARRNQCDLVLSLVAALAPNESEMGPYAADEFRSAVAMWV